MNEIQDSFNPQESAESLKIKISNYSRLTVEIVEELHRARDFYSNRGHRSDLLTNDSKLNSFNSYLNYIGLYERKAYRWLERYIPEEHKLLTYEEFSEKKADEARAKLSEEERNRAIIAEYRKTGKKVAGWTPYHEKIVQRDAEEEAKRQQRISELKIKQNEESKKRQETYEKFNSTSTTKADDLLNGIGDALRAAASTLGAKHKERQTWKEKIRLSADGKENAFMDAIIDYMETLENDTRRIEACNNIIKICRNISVELQRAAA